MSVKSTPTMRQIADDLRGDRFRAELRGSWAIAVLYRLPSLPLVWLAARAGIGPTVVTLIALTLALTMPLQALLLPLALAPWCIAASGALFQVLDCVDGTLARVTGRSSRLGGDLDFLTDMVQWGLLYLAIGILADRTLGTGSGWSMAGACAAWLRLFVRVVRDRLSGGADEIASVETLRLSQLPVILVAGLSGLIPFMALGGSYLWLSVLFLLVYALLDLGDALLALRRTAQG